MKLQVDIPASEDIRSFFFICFGGPGETYLDFKTGVLLTISIHISWAKWFGLGSHFLRKWLGLTLFTRNMFIFPGTCSENEFFPKHPRQPGAFQDGPYGPYMDFLPEIYRLTVHIYGLSSRSIGTDGSSISRFPSIQNGWCSSISRFPDVQNGWCSSISRYPRHQHCWFSSIPRS